MVNSLPFNISGPRQKQILILLMCLLIGFALRFYTFDQKSLWIDEIHTFNDSRDDLRGQMKWYKENPTFLHPPLFYILTHSFYPFPKPERDLRILPLVFGTLSIPMFYLLARLFSPTIALPCALSLTFMVYHISLSQDGRSYSLLMFLGMAGLYFFMKHLITSKKRHLLLTALSFALLFYTSYSSISFIALSQILWFYRIHEDAPRPRLSSFLFMNGLLLLLCLPWILYLAGNYRGESLLEPLFTQEIGSLGSVFYGMLGDWVSNAPLVIGSILLLIVLPILSRSKKNGLLLLFVFVLPPAGLYAFCKLLTIGHFFGSKYFINFLPLFFISLFLSLKAIEARFERLPGVNRLTVLFLIFLIASNLIILPLYYRSEKQDFRGLVQYLNGQLRDGDKVFIRTFTYFPGIFHYFNVDPGGRHYMIPFSSNESDIEFRRSLISNGRVFTIYHSSICCANYVADGSRLWIVSGKVSAKEFKKSFPCVLKGYFDGSFSFFRRFPSDASMYLFLWDPRTPGEKGIDIPLE